MDALVSRLEAVTTRLENAVRAGVPSKSAATESASASPFVVAFDAILDGPFRQFQAASQSIGGDLATATRDVTAAFEAQKVFLVQVSKSRKPDVASLQKALQPTSQAIGKVQSLREASRSSPHFNHLSALSESISSLAWVTISPAPAPFIKEMTDAGQFYTNRVLKEFKDKDKTHVNWVKLWLETLSQLQVYVKQHHTTGLSWQTTGSELTAIPPPSAPPAGGVPAPPPPPAVETLASTAPSGDDAGRSALFAAINKGTDISRGLKKVTDDMKTHKNPQLRSGPQPFRATSKASSTKSARAGPLQRPPKCSLEGKKWVVEYQNDNRSLVISDTSMKQTVYVYKCVNSTLQVKGKVNSIILDSCKKSGVVCDSVVSAIEFVNCQSVQGQALGQVPTVSIDKTDGCQVYLSRESAASTDIVSAKSSEMNILIPDQNGEYKEFAVPEQFRTKFNGKKLITEVSESLG